jgi:8-oxo-dGTP pyrophosphatase MutT (NUDIX family)
MSDAQYQSLETFIIQAEVETEAVRTTHLKLLKSNAFLRDQGTTAHFCVYFAGVNPTNKTVLLGNHKKAKLWLCSGGHIDGTETVSETLTREVKEEWGVDLKPDMILPSHRLTITTINNPDQPKCLFHYDLWHFITIDPLQTPLDENCLTTEYHQAHWLDIPTAKRKATDLNTLTILDWIDYRLFK